MNHDQDRNRHARRHGGQREQREAKPKYEAPVPAIPKLTYEPDPVNGKPIENIFTAIAHRESERPVNFDTALEQVRSGESLGPHEFICYVGAGNFAVYEEVEDGNRKLLVQKKKISYENQYQKPAWRKTLSPGISRDYVPAPERLDKLYTPEEILAFPKLGSGSSVYNPRNT